MKKGEVLDDRKPVRPSQPKRWECPYERPVLQPSLPRPVNAKPVDIDAEIDF